MGHNYWICSRPNTTGSEFFFHKIQYVRKGVFLYLVVPLMTVRFPVSYGRRWKDFPPHQKPSSQNPVGKTFPVPSQYLPGGQSTQSVWARAPTSRKINTGQVYFSHIFEMSLCFKYWFGKKWQLLELQVSKQCKWKDDIILGIIFPQS